MLVEYVKPRIWTKVGTHNIFQWVQAIIDEQHDFLWPKCESVFTQAEEVFFKIKIKHAKFFTYRQQETIEKESNQHEKKVIKAMKNEPTQDIHYSLYQHAIFKETFEN